MRAAHVLQSVIKSHLPFSGHIGQFKRRLSGFIDNIDNSYYCIEHGIQKIKSLQREGVCIKDSTLIEIGSGWLPIIPILFHIYGAKRLILTDVVQLMDAGTIMLAKKRIAERSDFIIEAMGVSRKELDKALNSFGFDYRTPWNAAAEPDSSVDLVISRAVLEHVPRVQVAPLFLQIHRILRPGGATCHIIDNSDHWEHRDKTISRVDFLRYEPNSVMWRLAQSDIQFYQNRLRHSDYLRMLTEAGFRILHQRGLRCQKALAALSSIPLAAQFQEYDREDLCTVESLIVARKDT